MIDFDRFWADCDETEAADDSGLAKPLSGAFVHELQGWEKRHGLTMPIALREAPIRQNGGVVRYSSVRILPVEEIQPASKEVWEFVSYDEADLPDRTLVFEFASDDESGGQYYLNFNARGRHAEPGVYVFHSDPGDMEEAAGSLSRFFERLQEVTASPQVDWSETNHPASSLLGQETVDVSPVYGLEVRYEQVLRLQGELLLLYSHLPSNEEERLIRLTLPLPLDSEAAMIQPHRPAPISTSVLHLRPRNTAGIVEIESTRTRDGYWKNTTTHGAPIYGWFESIDASKLRKLRIHLLGSDAARRAEEREASQTRLVQQLDSLAPEERRSAMLQAALKMHAEMNGNFQAPMGTGSLRPSPPELAGLAEKIKSKLADVIQRAQEQIAQHPPDRQTQEQIEEPFRKSIPRPKKPGEM
jgi:hypothetical protein